MTASQSRKLEALIALANRGATGPERVLAAHKAAGMCDRYGVDYLRYFPYGLPE